MRNNRSGTIHHASWLRAGTRFYGYVLLLLGLFATALPSRAQTENRIYTIGNSVTDGVNFQGFKALAESRGYVHTWGRQMIPGAPLSWLWQHPNDGFTEQPFGYPTNAFPNYTWDVISLQPFDRPLDGDEGDLVMSKNYIDLAKGKSPDVQVYIYSRYPRKKDGLAETAANWNGLWATAYQGGWSFNEGRDYFEKLTVAVRSAYAGTGLKQPMMIPLGEVMYNLNNKMAAGEVAGFSSIWQVYSDGIHMTNVGSYVVACTFFATMYKDSPVGLPVPTQYGTISNALRDVIQQTVWETVTGMPTWTGVTVETVSVTGVSLAPATATLALNQTQQLTPAITPANATNKKVSWSSSNAAVASVSAAGVVTGVAAGTATITVTTQDGAKTATSEITVTSNPVAVESISVTPASAVVNTGNTIPLTAAVTPSYATNQNITWSSSNAAVASVSTAGVVTGVSAGTATITVTTQDGAKTATSAITVTANTKPVAVLSATPASGFAPLNVRFSAANSSDPNNGDFILGYDWDFGDGSPRANSNAPSHTYTTPGTYTVTLRVMDNHDVYSDPVTTTITVNAIDPNASVVIEYWSNVGGTSTDQIPVTTPPTRTSFLTSLEIPADVADSYGARIRGLLKPAASGEYTFYVASDDDSKVFLSTDATPANKALIASVTGWTSQREWTKYPTQRSAAVSLVAGQEYYFEILYKEGNGGDNLAVGWTGPGVSAITVIGAAHIRQYVPDPTAPVPPSVPANLVASNVNQTGFTVSWSASTGSVASYNVYVENALAGNATTTSFNVTGLTAATAYTVKVQAVAPNGTLSADSQGLNVITAGTGLPSTAQKSLDLNFTDPADADRFAFIFDTGGESVKTVENGVMKLALNKKEWHFYQMIIDPFDFTGNPYVSFRIKVDQATPIRMWIRRNDNRIEKELFNQTIQPGADYQTINLRFTDLAPLVGDMTELGIDIGGYQTPPAVFAGNVYLDYFRLGEAARPTAPPPSGGTRSLNLTFTDPADADQFRFVIDTGGESVKTVENGVMKLVVNKLSWHFYQLMIDPFDFIGNPYLSFRIKVDQSTPVRIWIKKGIDTGIEKELFNQNIQASADFQVIQLSYTDLAPLVGDMTELGMDIGGYQPVEGTRFAGTVYLDYFRLGEAARPGAIVERDEVAPTAPSNLLSSAVTTNGFTLNWAPATDNVGVAAYKVYANDALVATTPATTLNAQLTGLAAATAYAVKVVAEDAAGNTTAGGTITVTTAAPAPTTLTREVWRNLTVRGIAGIPVNTPPTTTTQLTRLEGPADAGDNFGARIRAYITPAVSGYYTFYIAADDQAELWLSVNDNPDQKTRIAQVTKAVKPGEWTKTSGQRATEKRLLAGTRYYVEVLHRETTGRDFVSVAWTGPGVAAITPVPAGVLSPFAPGGPAPSPATYALTVNGGLGAGSFVQGAVVNISANPAPEGQVFDAWTGNVATVADVQSPTTTVTLPAGAVTLAATYKARPLPTVALTVNKNTRHQTIDGFGFFGARDVWWGSGDPAHFYSEAWLDLIVRDLGVSMWRNELYPHNPPTENNKVGQDASWDKQRPMVQALKAKADQYGVDMRMILTVWSPPGEFKWQSQMAWAGDVNATRGPGPEGDYYPERAIWPDNTAIRGTLNPNKYNEYATWLSQGLQMYKNIGINVYAISPQNEPMFPQSFNSNTYTTQWYADMINAVMPQVKARHPSVQVFGSENMLDMEGASNNFPFFYHSGLKADPTAMNNIDVLAVHGYLDGVSASSGSRLAGYWENHKREFSAPAGKKAWMTETSGYVDAWEGTSSKPGALSLAIDMQTALYFGDLSAWVYWQGSGLGGINEYNLMSDTQIGKKYYASKNFYRFIRPGAVRLATASPDPEVSITAYEHAANGTHTMVLINSGTTAKAMNLSVTGSGLPTSYEMFVTSATKNCESAGTVSTANSIVLPARSVVTLQAGGMPLSGSAPARVAADGPNKAQSAGLEGVTVYPNPTQGIVSVATGAAKEVRGTITTLQGVQLNVKGKQLGAGNLRFDISGQPSGIYLLKMEVDGRSKTYRILKQ